MAISVNWVHNPFYFTTYDLKKKLKKLKERMKGEVEKDDDCLQLANNNG